MQQQSLKRPLIIVAFGVILYLALANLPALWQALAFVTGLFTPVFWGIGIAFVLNLLMRPIENRLLKGLGRKNRRLAALKRPLAIAITFLIVLALIFILGALVLPQILESIEILRVKLIAYSQDFQANWENLPPWLIEPVEQVTSFAGDFSVYLEKGLAFAAAMLPRLFALSIGVAGSVLNFVLGLLFALYFLAGKERLAASFTRLLYAFAPKSWAEKTLSIFREANEIFGGFIGGQLTEAAVLGLLCFIGMSIFGFPYAMLISVLIGVTSLIPVLGAYLGIIPSAFILLIESPSTALWFLIFILILQQLENNLIYPRVVGNAIGIDGLWILLAIIVGGSLGGVLGILLGIPLLALLYSLLRQKTRQRLAEKEIRLP